MGRRLEKKLTRKAILDMFQSGHLAVEECGVELRELESRERHENKFPRGKLPEKCCATIPPHGNKNEAQEQQPTHAGVKKTAPSPTTGRIPQIRKSLHTPEQSEGKKSTNVWCTN